MPASKMQTAEAITIMQEWLRHLDWQREKAAKLMELAALARTGPQGQAEARRQLAQTDKAPRVYDGARLEPAVTAAIDALSTAATREADLAESRDFYQRRCDALQKAQNLMRDPERKMVCDILANGRTYQKPATEGGQ